MPRPRKWRKVCCLPNTKKFGPLDACPNPDTMIQLTVDEYETIRLMYRVTIVEKPKEPTERTDILNASHGDEEVVKQPRVNKEKVGRNDPCPCGSGKKYKHCCGK